SRLTQWAQLRNLPRKILFGFWAPSAPGSRVYGHGGEGEGRQRRQTGRLHRELPRPSSALRKKRRDNFAPAMRVQRNKLVLPERCQAALLLTCSGEFN